MGTNYPLSIGNGWQVKMAMEGNYRKLRIFVASPSEVASACATVTTVSASLEPLADYVSLTFEVLDWYQAVPDMGCPQQIIFD